MSSWLLRRAAGSAQDEERSSATTSTAGRRSRGLGIWGKAPRIIQGDRSKGKGKVSKGDTSGFLAEENDTELAASCHAGEVTAPADPTNAGACASVAIVPDYGQAVATSETAGHQHFTGTVGSSPWVYDCEDQNSCVANNAGEMPPSADGNMWREATGAHVDSSSNWHSSSSNWHSSSSNWHSSSSNWHSQCHSWTWQGSEGWLTPQSANWNSSKWNCNDWSEDWAISAQDTRESNHCQDRCVNSGELAYNAIQSNHGSGNRGTSNRDNDVSTLHGVPPSLCTEKLIASNQCSDSASESRLHDHSATAEEKNTRTRQKSFYATDINSPVIESRHSKGVMTPKVAAPGGSAPRKESFYSEELNLSASRKASMDLAGHRPSMDFVGKSPSSATVASFYSTQQNTPAKNVVSASAMEETPGILLSGCICAW